MGGLCIGYVSADVLVADSPQIAGLEDSSIPFGLSVDLGLVRGGSQLDIIGADIGFSDASAASTLANFTIPPEANFVRITGMGGNDNDVSSSENLFFNRDKEYQVSKLVIDLGSQTCSGHLSLNSPDFNGGDNYTFSNIALRASSVSGESGCARFYSLG